MIRLTLLFISLTALSFGQTNVDYELYSQVVNDYINNGIKYDVKTTEVVIIAKYAPDNNEVSFYGKEFLDSDKQMINVLLHYDTMKIRLFRDNRVRDAIKLLEKEFYETQSLDKSKFNLNLNPTIFTVTNKKFESYFKTIFGKRIDRGWKKFYKKYPGSHGVFEFSKIIYRDDYACFYAGRHSNGLSGSGDLVIAKKMNGNWKIINFVNIWMS